MSKSILHSKERIIKTLTKVLKREEDILFAILFGSYARGDYFSTSDIDVAVYLKKYDSNSFHYVAKLEAKLMSVLKTDNVDLVILNDASPALKYEIVTEGELLFAQDEDEFYLYYSYVLREFFDFRYHQKKFFNHAVAEIRRKKI